MKKEVLLQFPVYELIRTYVSETDTISYGVIPSKNILRCLRTDDQLKLAVEKYDATLLGDLGPGKD